MIPAVIRGSPLPEREFCNTIGGAAACKRETYYRKTIKASRRPSIEEQQMRPPTKKRRKPATINRAVALQRIDKTMELVFDNVKMGLQQEAALRIANVTVRLIS